MSATPVILCVDDEPIVLRSLREQFERELGGCEIEVAEEAGEALEILDELRADGVPVPVVLSDHIMPGMKGDELLVRVHERSPETRTVLLTGQAGLDAVARAVNAAGLYRYISKPWDRHDLTLTVREAMRSYLAEARVREQQLRLAAMHQAAMRFVPSAFLSLFGRAELSEVERGDFVARPLTVYYSDIRSYSTLVEGHSPAENLAWINDYLMAMERPIHGHGGFVERIAGDSIVALFGTGADEGLRAAIESLEALSEHNVERRRRGQRALEIGIGLTSGECLLGILGGDDRLQCSVVGNPVNLAARVEGLTRHLGSLLITEQTKSELSGRYAMRFVDRVRVKGLKAPCNLYEVLDGLDPESRARKLESAARFEAAAQRLQRGDLAGAAASFARLAAEYPEDSAFAWHLARCEELGRQGLPSDWDGVVSLRAK